MNCSFFPCLWSIIHNLDIEAVYYVCIKLHHYRQTNSSVLENFCLLFACFGPCLYFLWQIWAFGADFSPLLLYWEDLDPVFLVTLSWIIRQVKGVGFSLEVMVYPDEDAQSCCFLKLKDSYDRLEGIYL